MQAKEVGNFLFAFKKLGKISSQDPMDMKKRCTKTTGQWHIPWGKRELLAKTPQLCILKWCINTYCESKFVFTLALTKNRLGCAVCKNGAHLVSATSLYDGFRLRVDRISELIFSYPTCHAKSLYQICRILIYIYKSSFLRPRNGTVCEPIQLTKVKA